MIVLAIVQKSTKFLVVRRKKNDSDLSWHFPGGLKELTDKREDQTAERETLEETGIVCKARKKIGARIHPKTNVKLAYWLCDYVQGKEEVMDTEELDMVRWASKEDIIKILGSDLYLPVRNYLENYTYKKRFKNR